jgi:hypothetical protein
MPLAINKTVKSAKLMGYFRKSLGWVQAADSRTVDSGAR